jgi:hypothetical protein
MLQQRAFHPRSDEARQNHQNPEAPLGFACLYKNAIVKAILFPIYHGLNQFGNRGAVW